MARPRLVARPRGSQARVAGVHQGAVARVAPSRSHLVRDVAESEASVRVAEPYRAARAEVPEAARPAAERPLRMGELEAEPEPGRPAQHEVLTIGLLLNRSCQRRAVHDTAAVERAATRQRRIEPGNARRGGVRIRRRYL